MQTKSGNHSYGYYLRLSNKYKKVDSDTHSSVLVLHPQILSYTDTFLRGCPEMSSSRGCVGRFEKG